MSLRLLPLLLLAACRPAENPEPERPPNIILIVADDLGYGDLGVYGQEQILTPRLDQMAAEGLRFTQFYSGSTVCAPSRASLMTGLHMGNSPIRDNSEIRPMGQAPLPDNSTTMAEVLKEAGYATGLIGKWGLGAPGSEGHPNRQGFDYFFGYLCQRHAHNFYTDFLFRNEERVPVEGNVMPDPPSGDGAGEALVKATYSHDLLAEEALRFVDEHADRPFFLALTLTIPHANNEAGERGMEVPDLGPYADLDWPEPQKGHAAMISRMDADVGRLVDKLKARGIDEHTLVVFTSDNGPHREGGNDPEFNDSNGVLRGFKRDLYEGGIRVPAILRWPGVVTPGEVSDHVVAFWDLLPTLAELAGVSAPEGIDGVSIASILLGKGTPEEPPYRYWEYQEKRAVRLGDWKGVKIGDAPWELYDLAADVSETTDLAADRPDVVARIEEAAREAMAERGE